MEILLKFTLAILGIALYTIFKAREYIFKKDCPFYFDVLLSENIKSWIWSLIVVAIIMAIITIEPNASEAIKTFTGLDLANTTIGFLTLGMGLTGLARNTTN